MPKKTKSNISFLELPFPKTWMGKKIKEPFLEKPVLAAQNELIGFKENEIKSLYADLEKVINAYKSQWVDCPIDLSKEPAAEHLCILSMGFGEPLDFIPWHDFINKWGAMLEYPFEGTSHDYDLSALSSRRLLAVLILHYASKKDTIKAREFHNHLINFHNCFDLKIRYLSKALEETQNKNSISKKSSERRKGQKTYEADEIITNEAVRLLEEEDRKNPSLKRIDKVRNIVEPIREFIGKEFAKDTKLVKRLPTLLDAKNIEGRIIRFYKDKK